MPRIYIETTIPSFLVARPSQDGDLSAKQAATRTWWDQHRLLHQLVTSDSVLDEARGGDSVQSGLRLASLQGVRVLFPTAEVEFIGRELVRRGWIPPAAILDAFHIAYASVYAVDFLLTWNCTHLANEDVIRPIERWLRNLKKNVPVVCTPTYLLDQSHEL